eukprot:XP_001697105.1 predicted protein [Chlamydomonas reinhardtii]
MPLYHSFVVCVVVLLQSVLLKATALQCISGTWSSSLQSCVLEGVLSSRRAVGYVLATPAQLGPNDVLKVHVRGVGPRLTASLLVGRGRRNSSSEYRRIDASELVFGLAAAELGGNNVTVYLENYSLLGLQFTVLAHVHRPDALLGARDSRLLAELGAQCCRPRSVGLWCTRLNMLGAALNVARPGHTAPPVGTRGPDVCSYPELWMPGALDCDGSWSALAGLAGATSLAWLDASLSALEFPLSSLSPLLASPALSHVVLTDSSLTGLLSAARQLVRRDLAPAPGRLGLTRPARPAHLPSTRAGVVDGGGGSMRGWSDCANLTYVDVGSNVLRGGVPDLPDSVLVLYLDNNALSGPLPAPLPPGLIILNASANALSGPLPRTQLDALRFLDLSRNRFSGGLPSSLASSSQLIYLNASFNNVSGTLVLFAFKLRSTPNSLQVLDLSHNSLSGSVPSYLSQLAVFSVQGALPSFPRVLDLSYNRLSGSVPDFVFRLLPPVVWSCRCLLLLALSGGGNQLTCPANAPALDSTSLYILWLYQVNCMDAQTNITYNLAQWLTPSFQRLTLPDASATAGGGNASTGGSSGSSGRSPGAGSDTGGYCDGSDPVAAASALCTYGRNPFARAGQGGVPEALKSFGWQQILTMTTAPASADGNSVPVQLSSSNSRSGAYVVGDMPWPLANILTIVLASLTAAIVLLIVVYLCARSWVALWADRMAQMEREAAQQDGRQARARASPVARAQ